MLPCRSSNKGYVDRPVGRALVLLVVHSRSATRCPKSGQAAAAAAPSAACRLMFPVASFRPSVESVDAHCTLHICMTRIFGTVIGREFTPATGPRSWECACVQQICMSKNTRYCNHRISRSAGHLQFRVQNVFSTRSPQVCSDAASGTYGPAQRSILRFQTIVSNSQLVESFVLLRYRFITLVHVLLLYAAL